MNRSRRMRTLILASTLTLLGATGAFAGNGGIRKSAKAVPNEYIVVLRKDIPAGQVNGLAHRLAKGQGAVPERIWTLALKGFFVRMTEKEAQKISADPAVEFVEENAQTFLAASTMTTNVDPATCALPGAQNCTQTDNRLWHLDRIDQDSPVPSKTFSYCATGNGVTVYVLDSGVHANHSEFLKSDGTSRVLPGFNASGDPWPADNPCGGWNEPAVGPMLALETVYEEGQINAGHGTGTAALAAGKKIGLAKDATIVPVKIYRCDRFKPRYRKRDHDYAVGDLVFDVTSTSSNGQVNKHWIAITAGRSADAEAVFWSASGGTKTDGTVVWQEFTRPTTATISTVQMMITGLELILDDTPPEKSIITTSVFSGTNETGIFDSGSGTSLQQAIHNVLAAGIPVIASANNQDRSACLTAPALFSRNNPNSSHADDVITVGGTMLLNDPESVTYDDSQPVRDARWSCADPDDPLCKSGSNGGPCVTLFAPAHQLTVASNYHATSYRARVMNLSTGLVSNSGTSWSAPIVAGVVAGYLEPGALTIQQIHDRLIADSRPDLDTESLNPVDDFGATVTGTPNLLLRAASVHVTAHPQSTPASATGSTVLSSTATGTGLTYQWFKVNSEFDLTKKRGAADSTPIAGATSSTFTVTPTPSTSTGYWVRVTGCGAADSDIAVVVPRPGAPSNLVATASGTSVSLSWSAGSGAEKYQIERKVAGQAWTTAGTVDASVLTFVDTPSATGGMVIYRVLSAKGVSYLPANNLALSSPSNNDIANVNSHTYENLAVAPAFTTFKAQMLIELRQAANALATAAGISTMPFTSTETQLSSLQGLTIQNEYLTDLMTKINSVRTNSLIGISAATWSNQPDNNEIITRTFVEQLRNALQ